MSEIKFNIPDPSKRPPSTTGVVRKVKNDRLKVFRHIVLGALWWVGTAVVTYFALQSTDPILYFFTGIFGAFYHWKRAIQLGGSSRSVRSKKLFPREIIGIVASIILVIGSTALIAPETIKVSSPRVGTCWAEQTDSFSPVACWGSNADFETVAIVETSEGCPSGTMHTLDPSEYKTTYTCLVPHSNG